MKNTFWLLRSVFAYGIAVRKQKGWMKRSAMGWFDSIEGGKDGSLPAADIKKIHYYTLYGTAVIGQSFCRLRGTAMEEDERERLSLLGILTPLLDGFFDGDAKDPDRAAMILASPSDFQPKDHRERISKEYLLQLLDRLADKEGFLRRAAMVFHSQLRSDEQQTGTPDFETVRQISYDKGGDAALLFRDMLSHPLEESEAKAVYLFGGIIQYLDDLFDLFEDDQAKTRTLPLMSKDIRLLALDFQAELDRLFAAFRNLKYSESDIRKFLFGILLICSRGCVALQRLLEVQQKMGGAFDPARMDRNELVTDMERPVNIFLNLRYYLRMDPMKDYQCKPGWIKLNNH